MRHTQLSVTNFLHAENDFLFILRNKDRVDAGKLNGIGGKLEPGEDYLAAAIRETKEETGYEVTKKDIKFSGLVHVHEGYEEDWIMCFYKIAVTSKEIPMGNEITEGTLLWIPANEVLQTRYELVDDLHYLWEKIVVGKEIFFMDATVNEDEKISTHSLTSISSL